MSERPLNGLALAPGGAAYDRGDYAAALRESDEAVRNHLPSADVFCNRARARHALGDSAGAIADATAALRLEPRHAWAHRTLGNAYLAQGNLMAALTCCDEAIRCDPALAQAYVTRGGIRLLTKEYQAALDDCNESIRLNPNSWGAYITRGNARYHLDDPDADDDYRKSFEMEPVGYIRAIVGLIAQQAYQDPADLFANCAMHLNTNPQDWISYRRRGLALLLLGRDEEAQRDFDTCARLNPAGPEGSPLLIAEAKRVRAQRQQKLAHGDSKRNKNG